SNYTITLYKGTTSTGSNCTITGNGTTTGCTITYNTAVAAGNTFQLLVHRTSFGNSVQATTTQTATVTSTGSDTTYASLSTACVSTVLAPCNVTNIPTAGTLANAKLTFGANVPAANSFTVTLMLNGAATASNCTIAAGNNSCTIAGGQAL